MPAVAFDTLKYADALRDARVPEDQARAHAEALASVLREQGGELATRADMAELKAASKADLAEMKAANKADMAEMRAELKADIAGVKADVELVEQRLGGRVEALRAEVASLKWMFGVIGAGVLLLVLRAFWPLAH